MSLLGAFLFTAQVEAQCGGKNLWTEFAAQQPQAAQAADAKVREMPFGEGRLFRLTRTGAPVSYVLGTIHIPDARYLPLSGPIRDAFDATKVTVLELNSVKEEAILGGNEAAMPEIVKLTLAEAGERPIDFLGPEDQAKVIALGEKAGMPGTSLLTFRPVILAEMMALHACPGLGKAEDGVDGELERLSLKNHKLVLGLETAVEQLSAFSTLPFEVQKEVLLIALRSLDRVPDALETLKQLYVEGRLGRVLLAMEGKIPEFKTMGEPNPRAYTIALIDERNRRMVWRALPLLGVNSTFLAVGAAHLPGENGILKLLQDAGYKVEKVQ